MRTQDRRRDWSVSSCRASLFQLCSSAAAAESHLRAPPMARWKHETGQATPWLQLGVGQNLLASEEAWASRTFLGPARRDQDPADHLPSVRHLRHCRGVPAGTRCPHPWASLPLQGSRHQQVSFAAHFCSVFSRLRVLALTSATAHMVRFSVRVPGSLPGAVTPTSSSQLYGF